MISSLFSRLIILFLGTLYPAYASYKAVRTKNVKEYVKWMMYWIVFAFFTCIETFTDIFLSWFPFYYEVKVVIVFWLLSPATKGSSTLYRKFVHPMLTRREQDIDEYLNQARERGYSAVLQLGSKGVNYATNVIMQTAIKGGGNLVQTIKRSYSLSDLSEPDMHRTQDELDEVMMLSPGSSSSLMMRPQATRLLRQRHHTPVGRSASGTRHSTGMYFTEVDVTATSSAAAGKQAGDFNYNIRSTDDISSGYSSAEPISVPVGGSGLSRTSSMTNASKARAKSKRSEQMLEDLRAEVYLENERYFQVQKEQPESEQRQRQSKIVESSEEENEKNNADVEDTDEDEDSFYEAMPMLEEEATVTVKEPPKEMVHEEKEESHKETEAETNSGAYQVQAKSEDFHVDPFLVVLTQSRSEMEAAQQQEVSNTEDALAQANTVSPRELLATLEQIKHSFRAQLEPDQAALRPRAQHAKGRAPAPPLPPLPPRKDSRVAAAADSVSITSTTSQSERGKSGIGHLFKSIKNNVRRKSANLPEPEDIKKETSI
ncbi:uncharacterized protein LOC6559206 isoform X3 [Drosophila grimshawi]|uniref:uncharacterized protein LOC6559206 isoform X3 n=1 Tax=Drosophila grimshawi TaxID=7222 RepID=UPI000C86EBEE|nr:uncharacterized protein LOC6559206 isoform X3 [Drosophila grimshawi]